MGFPVGASALCLVLTHGHGSSGCGLHWDRRPCLLPAPLHSLGGSVQPSHRGSAPFRPGSCASLFLGCGLVKGTNTLTISFPRGPGVILVACSCHPAGWPRASRAQSARAVCVLPSTPPPCPGAVAGSQPSRSPRRPLPSIPAGLGPLQPARPPLVPLLAPGAFHPAGAAQDSVAQRRAELIDSAVPGGPTPGAAAESLGLQAHWGGQRGPTCPVQYLLLNYCPGGGAGPGPGYLLLYIVYVCDI